MNNLREISVQISAYCNCDCSYCFQRKDAKNCMDKLTRLNELVEFIKTLPLKEELLISITGEPSLFCDVIENLYKRIKKVERHKDTRIKFGTFTNGTNIEGILSLINKDILDVHSCKFSWDGVESSKTRPSKIAGQDSTFFNRKLLILGQSKFSKDILVRTALHPDTIDTLYESVKFLLLTGCRKWEYYFLTDCEGYRTNEFIYKLGYQLERIAKLYYEYPDFQYYNWDRLYYTEVLLPDIHGKLKSIGCGHLGETIYISKEGEVFPCGFFSQDCKYCDTKLCFGDIKDPFNPKAMDSFTKDYQHQLICDYQNCKNLQCFECPGLVKHRTEGDLKYKTTQVCRARDKERETFLSNHKKRDIEYEQYVEKMFTSDNDFKKSIEGD